MSSVSMREMLQAGVHFGHQTRFWNPKMAQYIFGHRNKIHIINLEKSLPKMEEALQFVRQLAANGGNVLMVGTKRQSRDTVMAEAQRAGVPFVTQRWLGGMLTNFKTVKTSIKRLKEMHAQMETGMDHMSKKEQLTFTREMEKLERDIGGIQNMNALPDAIFVIDVGYHKIACLEARKLGIPLVGVVDSNHSPEGIDYVIPGNDDALKSVRLLIEELVDSVEAGAHQHTDSMQAVGSAERSSDEEAVPGDVVRPTTGNKLPEPIAKTADSAAPAAAAPAAAAPAAAVPAAEAAAPAAAAPAAEAPAPATEAAPAAPAADSAPEAPAAE